MTNIKTTSVLAEISDKSSPEIKTTLVAIEVSNTSPEALQVTQAQAEVSDQGTPRFHSSQSFLEVSDQSVRKLETSQAFVEVSYYYVDPGKPIPSAKPLDSRINPGTFRSGSLGSFRWRGAPRSQTLVGILETVLSEIMSLRNRILLGSVLTPKSPLTLDETLGSGIYFTGDQDLRRDLYADGILHLNPVFYQVSEIRLQTLRLRLQHRLSS